MASRNSLTKYAAVFIGVVLFVGVAAVGRACWRFFATPPPFDLGRRITTGMALADVRGVATGLGFAWRVNEATLMDPAAKTASGIAATGHVICHGPKQKWLCENFADATAFGALFDSHACNFIVKDGSVAQIWLYMD